MERERQRTLQALIDDLRRRRVITPLARDVAEAMIWKCRKRADGGFMVSYAQLAGMARCSRDTAIEAVKALRQLGVARVEKSRTWSAVLHKWLQGKNAYHLTVPPPEAPEVKPALTPLPESENPPGNTSLGLILTSLPPVERASSQAKNAHGGGAARLARQWRPIRFAFQEPHMTVEQQISWCLANSS